MTTIMQTLIPRPNMRIAAPRAWRQLNKSTVVMTGVTVALFTFFSLATDTFMTKGNLSNLATQIAPVVVVGVAMTFVITTGQIDLSVGSIIAFVAAISAQALESGVQSVLVIVIGLAAGFGWGLVNGWFSAHQRIPSFIVTLATMSIVRGIAQYRTEGYSVPIDPGTLIGRFGTAQFLGFSCQAWVALAIVVIGMVVLHLTPFGNYVNGIGSNEESVRRAGVNAVRVKILVLAVCGMSAGLAGIMIAGTLGSGSSNSGSGFELTVITAVVLGGTALAGGRGTVFGSLLGALITGSLSDGLTLLGVSAFLVPIVTGTALILAIWVNQQGAAVTGLARRITTGRRPTPTRAPDGASA